MGRVTLNRNKRKLGKALKVLQRRNDEEQMDSESYFLVGQSQDSGSSLSKIMKATDFEPF